MNIKRAGILLGAAILMSAPLAYSPQAEARGGQGSHKGEHGQHSNRGNRGRGGQHSNRGHGERGGHHSGGHYRGERPDYYGHRHGRYRCDPYRCGGYDYHYAPYDYYYDSRLVLGLPWPYGITVIYQD